MTICNAFWELITLDGNFPNLLMYSHYFSSGFCGARSGGKNHMATETSRVITSFMA